MEKGKLLSIYDSLDECKASIKNGGRYKEYETREDAEIDIEADHIVCICKSYNLYDPLREVYA